MTDNKRTLHALKKVNEILTLTFTHYIPQGKQLPESYRDTLEVLYEVLWEGKLDHIVKEPLIQPEVSQSVMMFAQKADEKADNGDGIVLDKK